MLLSSEDYVDAFERLIKLNLKDVQEREIPRVILHCCGNVSIEQDDNVLFDQNSFLFWTSKPLMNL